MSDINVNLNLPIDYESLTKRIEDDAINEIAKRVIDTFLETPDYEIEDIAKKSDYQSAVQRDKITLLMKYILKEAVDEHIDEILEKVTHDVVNNISKRRLFRELVSNENLEEVD